MEKENPVYSTDVNLFDKYLNSPKGQRRLRYKEMLAKFQKEHFLSEGELFSKTREQRLVQLRWEFFYLVRNELGYSFSEMGRMFNINNTTVLHGYKSYKALHGLGRQDSERKTKDTR